MAADSTVKYPYTVEWSAKLPFQNVPSISPVISDFEGIAFYLELKCQVTQYDLYLRVMYGDIKVLQNYTVSTFVRDSPRSRPKLIDYKSSIYNYSNLWGKTTEEILDKIPDIFTVGKFTIVCVFVSMDALFFKTPVADVSTQTALSTDDLQSLSRDFSTCLKDKTFSDVKLKCGKRSFSANRSVLAARSEVFAAMFRNKMSETENGVVNIKDEDPEVIKLLLEYMYSAKMPDLREETAPLLYQVADLYAVYGLRRACADWMVEHQTTDNCLDLLVLADKHLDENFKDAIASFVAEHLEDLSAEYWSTFNEMHPLFALSVLKKRYEDSMPGAAKRAKH